MAATFVIKSTKEVDDETSRPLYWSNDFGWVSEDSEDVTMFDDYERTGLNLPINGEWERR